MEEINRYTPISALMELPEFGDYLSTEKRKRLSEIHLTYSSLKAVCRYTNEELKDLYWIVFSKSCMLPANQRWWIDKLIRDTCIEIVKKYEIERAKNGNTFRTNKEIPE